MWKERNSRLTRYWEGAGTEYVPGRQSLLDADARALMTRFLTSSRRFSAVQSTEQTALEYGPDERAVQNTC